MSRRKHPDKGGTKEAFQELSDAYQKLGNFIKDLPQEDPDDYEETNARDAFNNMNFTKENIASFTVFIQSNMVKYWEVVLTEKFEEPIDRTEVETGKNNGKQWIDKAFKDENEQNASKMYITIWHKKAKEHF